MKSYQTKQAVWAAVAGACLVTAGVARAADDPVAAPGATLQKLADGFSFTEGPTCDAQGNVYFTDQPNDQILKWSVDGKLSTFLKPAGRANGMHFDAKGNLLACADEQNQLWSIDHDGKHTVLLKDYEGKLLNGPNDLWVAPNGAIFFTDPFYKRPYWKGRGDIEQGGQHVYYLPPDRSKVVRVTQDLKQPNGITGTPDGKQLYVADIGDSKTFRYDIQPDGALANRQLFCSLGSDGVTIDVEGNLYLTGKGVTVFNPAGRQIDHIDVPGGWTANASFGGKDHQTLFITSSKSFYSLRLRVKGANPYK
jgi:gluconolactonase